MTNNSTEALRKLVAEARRRAFNLGSAPDDSQAGRTRILITRLADALEPLLDASERVGERGDEIEWTAEMEAERIRLCEFFVREGDKFDDDPENRWWPEMAQNCRRVEKALKILGEIACLHGRVLSQPQPPGAPEGGWRPIESAPRDGTHVLACVGGLPRSSGEAFWWEGAWRTWDGENHTRTYFDPIPTLWQPIPEPPHE